MLSATTTNRFPAASIAPHCPLCGGGGRRLFKRGEYWICGCSACEHRYADVAAGGDHVARHYGDDYFFGGGAGFPDYLQEAELLREHGRFYARMMQAHCEPGRVLDVGAAAGFVLEGFIESGWSGAAIEPNATMARELRQRLGCAVHESSLESFTPAEQFDLVMMIQVIPHFTDMSAALRAAAAATRPGGYWLIETWDRSSRAARLFGRQWHEYSPPTVLHWFTPQSLAALAGRFGFVAVERGRLHKRITAAHAKSLLRYRLQSTRLRRLLGLLELVPDRLAVPYPGDDLFWMLLQQTGAGGR